MVVCWQFEEARRQAAELRRFPDTFIRYPVVMPGFNWAELILSLVQQVPPFLKLVPPAQSRCCAELLVHV